MIPLRVLLQCLAYVLAGRADWLARKARGRQADPGRTPGRQDLAAKARHQAEAVSRLVHRCPPCQVDAALASLVLANAAGHLDANAALKTALAAVTDPETRAVLAQLRLMEVLP